MNRSLKVQGDPQKHALQPAFAVPAWRPHPNFPQSVAAELIFLLVQGLKYICQAARGFGSESCGIKAGTDDPALHSCIHAC